MYFAGLTIVAAPLRTAPSGYGVDHAATALVVLTIEDSGHQRGGVFHCVADFGEV